MALPTRSFSCSRRSASRSACATGAVLALLEALAAAFVLMLGATGPPPRLRGELLVVAHASELPDSNEAHRAAVVGPVAAARHGVGGVALHGGDGAVGLDGLHDADVLVPDDEIARLRGGGRAPGALGPGPDVVDAAEALAHVAQRRAALAGRPGGEVGAPGTGSGVAGGGLPVLRDARGVVGARRLLADADLGLGGREGGLPG